MRAAFIGTQGLVQQQIEWTPQNQTISLAHQLIANLQVTDLRYDVSALGGFLRDIPMRMGHNQALDAAADALNHSFSALYSGRCSTEAYEKYGYALKTMRSAMTALDSGSLSSTMCAMYLIILCEGWMRILNTSGAHGAAMAHLLELSTTLRWDGAFEQELVLTTCVSVIMEALVNPQISLGPWFTSLLSLYSKAGSSTDSVSLQNLAQIPGFIYRPQDYLADMQRLYTTTQQEMSRLEPALSTVLQRLSRSAPRSTADGEAKALSCRIRARYGTVLSIATILNRMLQIHQPCEPKLVTEAGAIRTQALLLAASAIPYRPLGASYIPLLLVCSLAATEHNGARGELEQMLEVYESDYAGHHWRPMVAFLERRFQRAAAKFLTASLGTLTFDGYSGSLP